MTTYQLTVSLSLFLPVNFEMDSPTLLTSLKKPAPLMAAVSLALGSCQRRGKGEGGKGRERERERVRERERERWNSRWGRNRDYV